MRKLYLALVFLLISVFLLTACDRTVDEIVLEIKKSGFYESDDWNYEVKEEFIYLLKYKGSETNVTVPPFIEGFDILSIEPNTFANNTRIESIILSNGITYIAANVFSGCDNLKSVTLPGTITGIGLSAFSQCPALESVIIADGFTTVNNFMFLNCSQIKSITLPDSVITIGADAFKGCSNLILKVGKDSFGHKYALENNIRFEIKD